MITVITPTLTTRPHLLERCVASVKLQVPPVSEHLVGVDGSREGPCAIRNNLSALATTEWLLFLDDDDELLPNYTQTVRSTLVHANSRVAVVYTAWEVIGNLAPQPLLSFHPEMIYAGRNHVPVTACVRRSVFNAVEGFHDTDEFEDLGLWKRILDAGYDFAFIPKVAWRYHRDNDDSRNRETTFGRDGCSRCGCRGACGVRLLMHLILILGNKTVRKLFNEQ